MIIKCEIDFQR